MEALKKINYTRSFGLLENLLAKKRAEISEKFIEEKMRNGRILDVGCGFFPFFLSTIEFKEKYGLDKAIDKEKFPNKNIKLTELNLEEEKIPYQDNYFDTIVMLAVFEHIGPESLNFVLKEIHRVLKKGGIFILTTPSPWSVPILWSLSRIKIISQVEIDDHKSNYSTNSLKELIRQAGFFQNKIKTLYFEIFLNRWLTAKK
jgi:SAM-dependent methyltransferase